MEGMRGRVDGGFMVDEAGVFFVGRGSMQKICLLFRRSVHSRNGAGRKKRPLMF